jgi:hypothetical protein
VQIGITVNGAADARYRYAISYGYRSKPQAQDAMQSVEQQLLDLIAQHRQMRADALASGETVR